MDKPNDKPNDVYKEAIDKAEKQLASCLDNTDNLSRPPSQCINIIKFINDVHQARLMNAFYKNGIGF